MIGVTVDALAAFDDAAEQLLGDAPPQNELPEYLVALRFLFEAELVRRWLRVMSGL